MDSGFLVTTKFSKQRVTQISSLNIWSQMRFKEKKRNGSPWLKNQHQLMHNSQLFEIKLVLTFVSLKIRIFDKFFKNQLFENFCICLLSSCLGCTLTDQKNHLFSMISYCSCKAEGPFAGRYGGKSPGKPRRTFDQPRVGSQSTS